MTYLLLPWRKQARFTVMPSVFDVSWMGNSAVNDKEQNNLRENDWRQRPTCAANISRSHGDFYIEIVYLEARMAQSAWRRLE